MALAGLDAFVVAAGCWFQSVLCKDRCIHGRMCVDPILGRGYVRTLQIRPELPECSALLSR